MAKRIEHPEQELARVLNTVYHRGANAFVNHAYLIEQGLRPAREHRNVLGRLEELGARNLRHPPSMGLESRVAGRKRQRIAASDVTGCALRWENTVDFGFAGRRKTESHRDYTRMSNDSYAFWRAVLDVLDEDTTSFKERFQKDTSARVVERRRRNLDELVAQGLVGLPDGVKGRLSGLVDPADASRIVELLRYAPELRSGDAEAVRYKAFAGNVVERLFKMLRDGEVDAPNAFAAVYRIKSPNFEADRADWLVALACAAQVVQERASVVFGREREDILYAAAHDVGFPIGLRSMTRPVHWYREVPLAYRRRSLERVLQPEKDADEVWLTRAEAEGIRRKLKGFWPVRYAYARELVDEWFGEGQLDSAAKAWWELYRADKAMIALGQGSTAATVLPKQSYKLLEEFFTCTDHERRDAAGKPREVSLVDTLVSLWSLPKLERELSRLAVEARKALSGRYASFRGDFRLKEEYEHSKGRSLDRDVASLGESLVADPRYAAFVKDRLPGIARASRAGLVDSSMCEPLAKYAGMADACVAVRDDVLVSYARDAMARGLLLGVKGVSGSGSLPSIERMDVKALDRVRRAAAALRRRAEKHRFRESVGDRSVGVGLVRRYDGAGVLVLGWQGDPHVITPSVRKMVATTAGAIYAKPRYVDWVVELLGEVVPLTDEVRDRLLERSAGIRERGPAGNSLAWLDRELGEWPRYVSSRLVDAVERAYEDCGQKVVM